MHRKAHWRDANAFPRRRRWMNLGAGGTLAVLAFWGSVVCGQQTSLRDAAKVGDTATIRELILAGGAVDEKDGEEALSPLHWAVSGGHVETARLLLVAGADLEAETKGKETPLAMAVRSGNVTMIRLLVRAGADMDRETADGKYPGTLREVWNTPLTMAARQGNVTAVIVLLSAGAKVNTRAIGATLYDLAARGDVDMLSLLLSAGVDADAERDPFATGSIVVRCTCGEEYQDETALVAAAKGGHGAAVAVLLAAGADPNLRFGEPLYYAAASGCSRCVEKLMDAGAGKNVNTRSFGLYEELTALDAVLASRQSEETVGAIVDQLISGGAKVNAHDFPGPSPLHRAAEQGYARVASVLLRAGAKLDAKDRRGRTPLDLAVQAGKAEVAQVLRSAGKSRGAAD